MRYRYFWSSKHLMMTLCLCVWLMMPACFAEAVYPFSSDKQTAQFNGLLKTLRCLVCQNQDLADSHAPLAQDLREEVYQLVREGRSDDEIIRFLTLRYGDFILFKPTLQSTTFVLWFAPMIFLCVGCFVLWRRTAHE